jgi:hypothetical protein
MPVSSLQKGKKIKDPDSHLYYWKQNSEQQNYGQQLQKNEKGIF